MADTSIKDLADIATEIMGTSKTEMQIIDEHELSMSGEDFLDIMVSHFNIEYCDGCGTWLECCEFSEEEGVCLSCSSEKEQS